jgi:peptidoglycan/xylan/chitin deacetylase (PgdA/CDA1 family)
MMDSSKEKTDQLMSIKMRVALAAIVVLVAFFTIYCKIKKSEAPKTSMEKCVEQLKRIPEVGALLKSQARETAAGDRPLAGMEIALTLNGMIQSRSNPDDEIDSWCEYENTTDNLDKLVRALKENDMPPTVDFVVGQSLDKTMMERWLQSGNQVGNMTYSRIKARKRDPQAFIADVQLNDKTLAPLLEKYPSTQKYFRYPRLKVSKDAQGREQIRNFLKENGYLEAMATLDIPDEQFSDVYCAARARGDENCAYLIKEHYKMLLLDTTLRTRVAAENRTGYDVKMILNVSLNQFTCDFLGEVILWYKNLGARFIPLDEALRDPLYTTFDDKGRPVARAIIRETRRAQLETVNAK